MFCIHSKIVKKKEIWSKRIDFLNTFPSLSIRSFVFYTIHSRSHSSSAKEVALEIH